MPWKDNVKRSAIVALKITQVIYTWITNKVKGSNMKESNGWVLGIVVTVITSIAAALFVKMLSAWWLNPFVGTPLAWSAFFACVVYVGFMGLGDVPVGFKGVQTFLEGRIDRIFPEGKVWAGPPPFGGVVPVDVRDKAIKLPDTSVLSVDNVPVTIERSALQTRISNPYLYLSAFQPEQSLVNATMSDMRSIINKVPSATASQEKDIIAEALRNGEFTGFGGSPMEKVILKALADAPRLWGIEITQVQIGEIRVPKELEEAKTQVQVEQARIAREEQQAISEMTEAKNVAAMIKVYTDAGLSPQAAADIVQTERGKATRVILDGGAKPIERAGALAGGLLGSIATPSASSPTPPATDPASKDGRRRGK